MEARTKKAREIVEKIDTLKKHIELISSVNNVKFINNYGPDFYSKLGGTTEELKAVYVELVNSEIEVLEKNLEEL
jgi:hypothetical protein